MALHFREEELNVMAFPILIVDDSAHNRILLAKQLTRLGYSSIESAENGKLGLSAYQSLHPGIIFLDGIMPEMDGLEVLREIRKVDQSVVVVITSSMTEREKILQFKEAGADFYLVKPFETEKFEEVLKKAVDLMAVRSKE